MCPVARSVARLGSLLPLTAGLVGVLWAGQVWAAVPVEDMSTRDIRPPEPIADPVPGAIPGSVLGSTPGSGAGTGFAGQTAEAPGSVGGNAQLFFELQQIQSELQQLRGLVEDQAYEISRLRDLQRSQYLDIDRRLTEDGHSVSQLPSATAAPQSVTSSAPTTPEPIRDSSDVPQVPVPVVQTATIEPAQTTPGGRQPQPDVALPGPAVEAGAEAGTVASSVAPLATSPQNEVATDGDGIAQAEVVTAEKLAFDRAFELMKEQRFDQSIDAYQQIVEGYPQSDYAPESRYWLGELYLMSDRLEAARGSFMSVVEGYPAHKKVPLSLYKLGVVNHRLGATPAALEYLDSVVTRYPDTPAAGLARTYAAELR